MTTPTIEFGSKKRFWIIRYDQLHTDNNTSLIEIVGITSATPAAVSNALAMADLDVHGHPQRHVDIGVIGTEPAGSRWLRSKKAEGAHSIQWSVNGRPLDPVNDKPLRRLFLQTTGHDPTIFHTDILNGVNFDVETPLGSLFCELRTDDILDRPTS